MVNHRDITGNAEEEEENQTEKRFGFVNAGQQNTPSLHQKTECDDLSGG